jgi:hypothetical protein
MLFFSMLDLKALSAILLLAQAKGKCDSCNGTNRWMGCNGACFRLSGRVRGLGKGGTGEVKPDWEPGSEGKGNSLAVGFDPACLSHECNGANGFP